MKTPHTHTIDLLAPLIVQARGYHRELPNTARPRLLVVTASTDPHDTLLRVVDPVSQRVVAQVNTHYARNEAMAVSPDARFVVVAGWSGEVKIFEVEVTRQGVFSKFSRVAAITPHRKRTTGLVFTDNTTLVTCSLDGTRVVWDLDVRFRLSEKPRRLETYRSVGNEEYVGMSGGPDGVLVVRRSSGAVDIVNGADVITTIDMDEVGLPPITKMQLSRSGVLVTCHEGSRIAFEWNVNSTEETATGAGAGAAEGVHQRRRGSSRGRGGVVTNKK